jgi:hypothetical protein
VEDTFYQTFSVEVDYFRERKVVELKPGGDSIFVTKETRHEYVELVVDYWLQHSIRRQFDAFHKGFMTLCDGPAIHLFNAQVGDCRGGVFVGRGFLRVAHPQYLWASVSLKLLMGVQLEWAL